jgi:arylsulfatase A-like enzyme
MRRIRSILGAVLASALLACAGGDDARVEIELSDLVSGVIDGERAALPLEGEGDRRRIVQAAGRTLELFLRLPLASRLEFEIVPNLPSGDFSVSAATDENQSVLTPEPRGDGRWSADLHAFDGRAVRLSLDNRSKSALAWIRPRVVGRTSSRPPALDRSARPPSERINVVLYVVDTLRLDRMSVYGYERPTSPELAALAARGTLFLSAYAPGSKTPPTITALFASRHPDELGARLRVDGPARQTLAERFREAGYATAAFQANFTLREALGYARGFDEYRLFRKPKPEGARKVDAAELHQHVLAWLRERNEEPFFAYIQSMDVHYPYDAPAPFRERFVTAADAPVPPAPPPADAPAEAQMQAWYAPNLYDASVAYADHEIGALMAALEELPGSRRTVVVVTSDHGEPLGQRGDVYHGHSLYEELVHVPLLMLFPWRPEPVRVDAIVSLSDLAPTLLDLAGLPVPDEFTGRSLLRPTDGLDPPAAVGSKDAEQWYIREGRWKLLLDRKEARLFDLAADPLEMRDVSDLHPVATEYLASRLMERTPAFLDEWQAPAPMESGLDADERKSLEDALRALGYLE